MIGASVPSVGALVALLLGTAIAAEETQDKWEATYVTDVWGDPSGVDLISHGHWHERGNAESDDPLLVLRCRKGKPLSMHVDWRQTLSPSGLLAYEVRGGPRLHTRTRTNDRHLVMFFLDPAAFLGNIEGHTHVAVFSESGSQPLSARFYVEDLGPAVRERCDASVQLTWADDPDEEPPGQTPIYVTGDVVPPQALHQPEAIYTPEAKRARIQGVVILQATISEVGEVTNVKVLKGLSHGLTETAVAALKQSRFEPATRKGVPVAVYYNQTVSFQLQ